MTSRLQPDERGEEYGAWVAWLTAAAVLLVFGALLEHLVFAGWAHTYDSAIYTRSLWGVANGELFNPVVGLHSLSVHGNFVLYALAPFAHVMHPARVLILAQALALAATVFMVVRAFQHEARTAGMDRWFVTASGVFAAFAVTVGSPMVVNPFLFDVRPDLIGVPLLTAGLLRAVRLGDFDVRAVAWMLSSLLVREEMMMVIVGALVFTPWPRPWAQSWRLRAVGTTLAVGWWALYWFGFRNWIGDGSYAIAQEVGAAFLATDETSTGGVLRYKVELVAVFLSTAGLLALFGRRWIGAALPGLAFLLLSSRMPELVLNFHYVLFVAPGLLAASVFGFRRICSRRPGALHFPIVAAVTITFTFFASSALPGGGRARVENFYIPALVGSMVDPLEFARLRDAHGLLREIPDGAGAAVPHELAAPLAARSQIMPTASIVDKIPQQGVPAGVDWVAIPGARWSTAGRALVDLHGFRLVGHVDRRLALLTRDIGAPFDWSRLDRAYQPADCRLPIGGWPAAGLEACAVSRDADGRVHVAVMRREPSRLDAHQRFAVVLRSRVGGEVDHALLLDGVLNPAQIPLGAAGVFTSRGTLPGGDGEVALFAVDGAPIAAVMRDPEGTGQRAESLFVAW